MAESSGTFSLSCARIFDGDRFVDDHALVIRDGIIEHVVPTKELPKELPRESLSEGFLAPGFIDLQVNGGGDVLFHDATDTASLKNILLAHRRLGTTSMLPTILSGGPELRASAIAAAEALSQSESGILGIHIEGPWFAPEKHGAHAADALSMPTEQEIADLCQLKERCLVTLAPEIVGNEVIAKLAQAGVRVAAGHTNASAEALHSAQQAGLTGVTHLYNAMSPLQTRAPGAVGAALTNDALWASIIADGHHVHADALRLALRAKPAGTLILVSDAMATVGGSRETFTLYDESIKLRNGRLTNAQGALAGSAIALVDAVRHLHQSLEVALEDALRMASRYPAQVLGMDRQLGSLAPGYRADIVHLDANLIPLKVWAAGVPFDH